MALSIKKHISYLLKIQNSNYSHALPNGDCVRRNASLEVLSLHKHHRVPVHRQDGTAAWHFGAVRDSTAPRPQPRTACHCTKQHTIKSSTEKMM